MINRNPRCGCVLAILFASILALAHQLLAQQSEPAAPPADPQTQTRSTNDAGAIQSKPAPDSKGPQNDRIFWSLPNYLTVETASHLPPLTTAQKFKMVAQGTFDPFEFGFISVVSAIYQADNTNPTFGQGLRGYAKRYGTAYTDAAIGNFMTGAVFTAVLRQDPRYYQMGRGNFLRRAAYAVGRVLFTRSDSGKIQINYSEFLGNGVAAAISNAYHPAPRTLVGNLDVWGAQIGWDVAGYELKEFWPDIHRFFRHATHKGKSSGQSGVLGE